MLRFLLQYATPYPFPVVHSMQTNEAFSWEVCQKGLGVNTTLQTEILWEINNHIFFKKSSEILDDVKLISCLLTTDKAHFHPSDYINKQKIPIKSTKTEILKFLSPTNAHLIKHIKC
jgi:hypothetical protein